MSQVKLSIITPTLNSGEYLRVNIESILKLNIPFEHIVVDGGSTDDTLKILQEYPQVLLIHQKTSGGMYQAIDMGFQNATGTLLTWINSDDYIIPEAYEKMYHKILKEKADLCYSNGTHYYVNENRYLKIRGKRLPKFLLKNKIMPFVQPCSIYTREIVERIEGLNFKDYRIAGDLDFFRRIASVSTKPFSLLREESCVFLKHGNSLGDNNTSKAMREISQMPTDGNAITKFLSKLIFKFT